MRLDTDLYSKKEVIRYRAPEAHQEGVPGVVNTGRGAVFSKEDGLLHLLSNDREEKVLLSAQEKWAAKKQKSRKTRKQKMQVSKKESATTPLTTSTAPKPAAIDPADAAGLPKVTYYKTDKWIVLGKGQEISHVSPKNVLPEPLIKSFVQSSKPDPVTEQAIYDRKKFTLDEFPDFNDPTGEKSRVGIWSHETKNSVAAVAFNKDTFVIELLSPPKSGVYPFNKDEFLKAINAAKWTLEMYVLPDSDRE